MITPVIPFRNSTEIPVGAIIAFAGKITDNLGGEAYKTDIDRLGWLVCDGKELEKCEYPELFSVIGELYGASEKSFNIPDLRGMFLRGIGNDVGSTESRKKAVGGEINGVGSTQDFAMEKHVHVYKAPVAGTIPPGNVAAVPVDLSINSSEITEIPTESIEKGNVKISENETRPINTFVYYIIKYRY